MARRARSGQGARGAHGATLAVPRACGSPRAQGLTALPVTCCCAAGRLSSASTPCPRTTADGPGRALPSREPNEGASEPEGRCRRGSPQRSLCRWSTLGKGGPHLGHGPRSRVLSRGLARPLLGVWAASGQGSGGGHVRTLSVLRVLQGSGRLAVQGREGGPGRTGWWAAGETGKAAGVGTGGRKVS